MRLIITALLVSAVLPSMAMAGADAYVSTYIGSTNHSQDTYRVEGNFSGMGIGLNVPITDSIFIKGEVAGRKTNADILLGIGMRSGALLVSVGLGQGQEEGRYDLFPSRFGQSFDTNKYTFSFVDLEYKGFFGRVQSFQTSHNFQGSFPLSSTQTETIAKSIAEYKGALQLGYRFHF